ncbi:MAG: hypothetical protein R8G66_13320 [Cytophagales bacterium]|nr:hypothetical protein [Cytophagales bacterium]
MTLIANDLSLEYIIGNVISVSEAQRRNTEISRFKAELIELLFKLEIFPDY